jgi:hypothetical protein
MRTSWFLDRRLDAQLYSSLDGLNFGKQMKRKCSQHFLYIERRPIAAGLYNDRMRENFAIEYRNVARLLVCGF